MMFFSTSRRHCELTSCCLLGEVNGDGAWDGARPRSGVTRAALPPARQPGSVGPSAGACAGAAPGPVLQ